MQMREPREIGADLRRWLDRHQLTEVAFASRITADISGFCISQPWLSRILRGQFRRLTPRIRQVAKYADIRVKAGRPEGDKDGAELIQKAVREVWNGSLSHADVIVRLIRVAKSVTPAD
jgi:hypothetical protein